MVHTMSFQKSKLWDVLFEKNQTDTLQKKAHTQPTST